MPWPQLCHTEVSHSFLFYGKWQRVFLIFVNLQKAGISKKKKKKRSTSLPWLALVRCIHILSCQAFLGILWPRFHSLHFNFLSSLVPLFLPNHSDLSDQILCLHIHPDGLSTIIPWDRKIGKGCRRFQKRSGSSRHSTRRRRNPEVRNVSIKTTAVAVRTAWWTIEKKRNKKKGLGGDVSLNWCQREKQE